MKEAYLELLVVFDRRWWFPFYVGTFFGIGCISGEILKNNFGKYFLNSAHSILAQL